MKRLQDIRALSGVMITNLNTGAIIGTNIVVARSFWQRFRGLMGTSLLNPGEGMLFPHTNSVHMFFMKYPLCVAYLSRDYHVLRHVVLKPWHIGPVVKGAYWVLELPADLHDRVALGDSLRVEDIQYEE